MSDFSSNMGSSLGSGGSAGDGSRIITAMFDSMEDALEAVERLRSAGLPEGSVRMTGARETGQTTETTEESKGFFEMLGDMFFPSDDREVYAEGLSRGGYLVTASDVPASLYDMAVDILDDEGAIDIDERSESWRSEGWTGTGSVSATSDQYQSDAEFGTIGSGSVAGGPGSGIIGGGEAPDVNRAQTSDYEGGDATGIGAASRGGMAGRSSGGGLFSGTSHDDEGVVPIVEERLRVGKRDTSHGRVRVRSYVVEEPVRESVTLAEERVDIERRPVDRAVTAGDDAFQQRTIEAEEFREEAVVSKEARVVEEIELRKTRDSRNETIEDTVRRTEVEVEHDDERR